MAGQFTLHSEDEAIKEFIKKVDRDVCETRAGGCDRVILHDLPGADLFITQDSAVIVQDRIAAFLDNNDVSGKKCETAMGRASCNDNAPRSARRHSELLGGADALAIKWATLIMPIYEPVAMAAPPLSSGQLLDIMWWVFVGVVGIWLIISAFSPSQGPAFPEQFDRSEKLNHHEHELKALQNMHVQTVTLLKAGPSGETAALRSSLEARLAEVVKLNPWVAGEIRTMDGSSHLTWREGARETSAILQDHFRFVSCGDSDAKAEAVATIGAQLQHAAAAVGGGGSTQGGCAPLPSYEGISSKLAKDFSPPARAGFSTAPLFHVALAEIPESGGDCFVVTSANHGVSDGATYYALNNMVSGSEPIEPLDPTRVLLENDEVYKRWMPEGCHQGNQLGVVLRIIACFLMNALAWVRGGEGPKGHGLYLVDLEEVKRRKAEASSGKGGFVSTNDVITSWWWSKFPEPHHKAMVVNLRERHPEVPRRKAGNYFSVMLVDPEVGGCGAEGAACGFNQSPSDVRRILEGGNPHPLRAMSVREKLAEAPIFSTNWAGFHKGFASESHAEAFHMPLPLMGGIHFSHAAVVFGAVDGKLAVYLDKCPFTSDPLGLASDSLILRQIMKA